VCVCGHAHACMCVLGCRGVCVRECMCVCVCVFVCVFVCVYVHMCICVCAYVCMWCVYVYVCVWLCVCVCYRHHQVNIVQNKSDNTNTHTNTHTHPPNPEKHTGDSWLLPPQCVRTNLSQWLLLVSQTYSEISINLTQKRVTHAMITLFVQER